MSYVLLEFKKSIREGVKDALDVMEEEIDIDIEIPSEERGVYAVPCYSLSPVLKKDPEEIAEEIKEKIKLENGSAVREGPYVNFEIDDDHLSKNAILNCLNKRYDFGQMPSEDKKITIEHTSANPNGPLHVGRARNPIIGDTLARIYEKMGYDVEKQYYVNDIGRQMAILAWSILNLDEEELGEAERKKKDHQLVRYYQKASGLLEKDEDLEDEIQDIIKKMEKGEREIFDVFTDTAEEIMSGIMGSLERLNIYFDGHKTESSLIKDGSVDEVIKEVSELDLSGKEDGAIYYEKEGNKIFITRENGTNLYPARDLAYHLWKAKKADGLVDVLGEDHKLHGRFIQAVLSDLDTEPIPQLVFHSFVTLEGKEMSTRKGSYVTLDEFMDTAREKAREEILKRRDDLLEEDVRSIAEKVGMGAVRFNMIKVQPEKPIDFVWDEALNFEGESAPFIQYSYTRANSILKKWEDKEKGKGEGEGEGEGNGEVERENLDMVDFEEGEIKLLRKIAELPRLLREARCNNAPHLLARYTYSLAAEFNQFYRDYPVINSGRRELERIALVKSFKFALGSALDTLGIEKPEKM